MTNASPAPSPTTSAASARLAGRLALGRDGVEAGAAIPKVATGIRGFDEVAMGGLPARRTTVVAGPAGAAKTLFAAQFLAEGVRRGQPGVFVTLEEPAADLRANFSTLGWDIPAWEEQGNWRFVDGSPLSPSEAGRDGNRTRYNMDTLAAQIGAAVDRTGAQRLAVDSLSAVLALEEDPAAARQQLRSLVLQLRGMGLTAVLTIETADDPTGALSAYGIEEFVADNVVLLRNVREGTFRRRTVEVLKMRGALHHKGDVPFTILPGEGLQVLPVTTPFANSRGTRRRLATGIAGVDELTSGGLFSGTTAVVTGPTGSGKTLIATRFAAEGVTRGEKVLFLAYEESYDQVLTNGDALGADFEDAEQRGLLHVVSLYPEVASLDDHLVELRDLIERIEPQRVVIDGLSALERLGSAQSYRGFLLGVTAFVRGANLTTLVTASQPVVAGGSAMSNDIAGLVDTIIVVQQRQIGSTIRRGLHVQRMRGSRSDNQVRELLLDADGIELGDPLALDGTVTAG